MNVMSYFVLQGFPCNVHLFNLRTLSHDEFYTVPDSSALLILNKQSSGDDNCNRYDYCDQFDEANDEEVNFELNPPIKVKQVTRTTLTGNDKRSASQPLEEERNSDASDAINDPPIHVGVSSTNDNTLKKLPQLLSNLTLEPMALEAFRVDF